VSESNEADVLIPCIADFPVAESEIAKPFSPRIVSDREQLFRRSSCDQRHLHQVNPNSKSNQKPLSMPLNRTPVKQDETKNPRTTTPFTLKQSSLDTFVETSPLPSYNNKRKQEEPPIMATSLDDIAKMILESQRVVLTNTAAESNKLADRVGQKIDELRTEVFNEIKTINGRVTSIEKVVTDMAASSSEEMNKIQFKLETLEQEKLANHMTISGLPTATVDASKTDPRKLVVQTLQSFGCEVTGEEIEQAFVLNTHDDKRRVVVVFRSAFKKSEVMKKKRETKDSRKIYFDHRMTPAVSKLFHQARHHAKEKGGRAFLYGSSVFYEKEPNKKIKINKLEDLSGTEAMATED
jgi:hypothetical protein